MSVTSVSTYDTSLSGWIGLYRGRQFHFLDPRQDEIHIDDIARQTSNKCRFNGAVSEYYSVAQHLVLASQQAPAEYKLETLLHDGSEGYWTDLTRPQKAEIPDYRRLEGIADQAVATKFNLPYPMSPVVREIDDRMLVTEAAQLLGETPEHARWWAEGHPYYEMMGKPQPYPGLIINPWPPRKA